MPEKDHNAAEVIQSYRRRRERMVPILLIGLAVVLVVVGVFLIVVWLTGDSGPVVISGFRATDTPTESPTETPKPPTATATLTLTPTPSHTPTPEWPKTHIVELNDTLSSIAIDLGVSVELIANDKLKETKIEEPTNKEFTPIGRVVQLFESALHAEIACDFRPQDDCRQAIIDTNLIVQRQPMVSPALDIERDQIQQVGPE